MIGFRLLLRCRQSLTGGVTESVFPQAEALLYSATDYQDALEEIGSRKDMGRYWSLMDFLFCELNPEWRRRCFYFYDNDTKPLRERLSPDEMYDYDLKLVVALEAAKAAWTQKLMLSWGHYREIVEELIAA